MEISLYCNSISQPSRAVEWFLRLSDIPYERKYIDFVKGDHKKPAYLKINPLGQFPSAVVDGRPMTEAYSIIRFLADAAVENSPYYPKNIWQRYEVNRYLDYHHIGTRGGVGQLIYNVVVKPSAGRAPMPSKEEISRYVQGAKVSIDNIAHMWLRDKPFICGDAPTVADLAAYAEIIQLVLLPDFVIGNERVKAWMKRMEALPHYESIHRSLFKFRDMTKKAKL